MAAVSGLMRRPLEQVGSGMRASAWSLPALRPLSASSLSLRQVSGLLRRRFHRTAPAALQVGGLGASPNPGRDAPAPWGQGRHGP